MREHGLGVPPFIYGHEQKARCPGGAQQLLDCRLGQEDEACHPGCSPIGDPHDPEFPIHHLEAVADAQPVPLPQHAVEHQFLVVARLPAVHDLPWPATDLRRISHQVSRLLLAVQIEDDELREDRHHFLHTPDRGDPLLRLRR
jgi:hypothetical protein